MTQPQGAGFLDALRALACALDEMGAPAMIIGGVAVIAQGVPRLTVDVDATVSASTVAPAEAAGALARHNIHPRIPDAEGFARDHHVYLAVHHPSGTPVDLSFAWLPFEEEALRAAEPIEYAGVHFRVARPEDLVIYKLVAARPRDIDDAEALLGLHLDGIDPDRVRRIVSEFSALLDDSERPRVLEDLIRRTRQRGQ